MDGSRASEGGPTVQDDEGQRLRGGEDEEEEEWEDGSGEARSSPRHQDHGLASEGHTRGRRSLLRRAACVSTVFELIKTL